MYESYAPIIEGESFDVYNRFYSYSFAADARNITIKEALDGNKAEQWKIAVYKEILENLTRRTFKFIKGYRQHVIDLKWVLKKKYLSIGQLEKFKARICARGFT